MNNPYVAQFDANKRRVIRADSPVGVYSDDQVTGGAWLGVPFQVRIAKRFSDPEEALAYLFTQDEVSEHDAALNAYRSGDVDFRKYGAYADATDDELDATFPVARKLKERYTRDTRLGANDAINCIWQFNRDDDIVHYHLSSTASPALDAVGEGRVYATTTETNQSMLWISCGVIEYTDISAFLRSVAVKELAELNNTGFSSYGIGRSLAAPFKLAFSMVVYPISKLLAFFRRFTHYPVSKFCALLPTMHLYYRYVDSIMTEWLKNTSFISDGDKAPDRGILHDFVTSYFSFLSTIFRDEDELDDEALSKYFQQSIRESDMYSTPLCLKDGFSIWDILSRKMAAYDTREPLERRRQFDAKCNSLIGSGKDFTSMSPEEVRDAIKDIEDTDDNHLWFGTRLADAVGDSDFTDTVIKTASGATQFVGFRINKSVQASESFSNSTEANPIAERINSTIGAKHRISAGIGANGAEGLQIDGALGKVVETAFSSMDSIVETLGDVSDLSGITDSIQTGSFIDLPEQYSGSSFGKSHSISLQLRSPYGDPSSIFQSIIVPLSMLLAMAMPRAAGPNSYNSPFFLRCYCDGRFSVPLGMIESMSVRRGDGEFGWTHSSLPTCVDVDLTIKDLTPALYMGLTDDLFAALFVDNTSFYEYLMTLSGMSTADRLNRWGQLMKNLSTVGSRFMNRYFNPNFHASWISENTAIRMAAAIFSNDELPTH